MKNKFNAAKKVSQTNSRKFKTFDENNPHFVAQFKIVHKEFSRAPLTMKECSVRTGIDRANICRYVRMMRKSNTVAKYKRVYCSITKHLAFRLTTNPKLFPAQAPTLFDSVQEGVEHGK